MKSVLVDAGALIALFAVDDKQHTHFDEQVTTLSREGLRLVTTGPCIVEASYLLGRIHRMELLRWMELGGVIIYPFGSENLAAMIEAMDTYSEPGKREMDPADASLYWLAVETGIHDIMTTDLRDFSRYKLPKGQHFVIL